MDSQELPTPGRDKNFGTFLYNLLCTDVSALLFKCVIHFT